MSKLFKKVLSFVVAMIMVCSLLPMSAMAVKSETYLSLSNGGIREVPIESFASTLEISEPSAQSIGDGNPDIVSIGVSPYTTKAIEDITTAMNEAGIIGQKIEIPEGCWNIAWMVLDEPATSDDSIVFYGANTRRPYSSNNVSAYDTKYTAGGYVFWLTNSTSDSIPTVFNPNGSAKTSFFSGNRSCDVRGQVKRETETYSCGPVNCNLVLMSKTEESKFVSNYDNVPLIGDQAFLYVAVGKTLIPKEYIAEDETGKDFTGYYSTDPDFNNETQIYSPSTTNIVYLEPRFADKIGQSIKVTQTANHGVVVVPSSAATGVTVTVKVTPNPGYAVASITATHNGATTIDLTPVAGAENEWNFVMPDGEVTINVTYEQAYKVTVNIDGGVGGSATATPDTNVPIGTEVQVKIIPAEDYDIFSVTAVYGVNTSVDVKGDGDTRTFIMPTGDVTVTVKFKEKDKYKVIIPQMENGTITAVPQETYAGDEVTLNILPNKGYALKSFYIYVNNTKNVDYKNNGVTQITFKMPASDVTVNATFALATYKTAVGIATLWDRPAYGGSSYNNYYEDSNSSGSNKMVGDYSLSEPIDKGTYQEYTLTAKDLHLFASVDRYHEDNPTNSSFAYYVGLTFEPVDGGSQTYNTAYYVVKPAESREQLTGAERFTYTGWGDNNNKVPLTIYFELDPDNPSREYWFRVTWAGNEPDYICIKVDATYLPITHTYEVPDPIPAGFSGSEEKDTSRGIINDEGFNDGFKEIKTPEQLGWNIPSDWTWYWLMDESTKVNPNDTDIYEVLSKAENNYGSMGHYYDHTFKLVIENIPQYEVTLGSHDNGNITFSKAAAETNKYNSGQTVTVTVQPNSDYDLSKLIVDGKDVTAQVVDGKYSFTIVRDVKVEATFISKDTTVENITVNGYTASHTGDKTWSIVLPWNETLPAESTEGFIFAFKNGIQQVTFKSATTETDESVASAKRYTFTIGEKDYTVEVKIAKQQIYKLTVTVTNSDDKGIPTEAKEGEELNITIIPKFGYTLPETVDVKIDGVTLSGKDYTYDKETGTITIQAVKVTGDVVITGSCGYGYVQVKANNEDITGTIDGVEVVNPTRDIPLPRQSNGFESTDLPAVDHMKDKSATVGANIYQWSIPEWLTFIDWKVNEDASGNHVDVEEQYTDLTANEDGSFTYQPKESNPNPIIIAEWGSLPTFEVQVTVLPGANDVYYTSDAPVHAGELVTDENLTVIRFKEVAEEGKYITVNLSADYEREGYRNDGWADEYGEPMDGQFVVNYEEGMENTPKYYVVQPIWTRNLAEIEGNIDIPAVFKAGENGLGADYETELTILSDSMSTAPVSLPTMDDAGFLPAGDYELTGWMLEQDGKTYTESIPRETLLKYEGKDVTFIAQWTAVEPMDIHYNVNPGNLPGAEETRETLSAKADPRTVTLPTTTEGVVSAFGWDTFGWEFLGWQSSDKRIDVGFEVGDTETAAFRPLEGMTITAHWGESENVETWTVSFDPGEGGTGTMAPLQKRVDKTNPGWTITVPACSFTAPEGKVFSHWTVDGKRISTGTYKVEKQPVVFTAVWMDTPDTVVNIYFRANGGSGSMQTAEVSIPWNEESTTYRLPACTITPPSGQVFAGWKYGDSVLSAGAVITVTQEDTSIELVAQWQPQSSVPSTNPGTGSGSGSGSGSGGTGTGTGSGGGSGSGSGTGDGTGTSTEGNPVITPVPDEQPMHGEVSSNVQSAAVGDEVTVLPAPDSKYMTGKVIVKDKDGNEVDVTWNGDGTYSFEMPEGGVTITAEFVTPDEVYEDVEAEDWYLEGVAKVANYGLMNGVGESDFGPDQTATRAQLMTILARRSHVYSDADGGEVWYKAGMDWAVQMGISDGTRPNDPLTRQEIIVMLYQYVGSPKTEGTRFATFTDSNTVASWAIDAMKWAVEIGIINGTGDNMLSPAATATRAELATILTHVMDMVEEF